MPLFLIIFGAIILLGSIGFSIYKTVMMNKTVKRKKKKEKAVKESVNAEEISGEEAPIVVKKLQNQRFDLMILGISTSASGIGGALLLVGALLANNLPVEAHHWALLVIGAVLFFPTLLWFFYTLSLKHFKLDMEDYVKRIVSLTNVIAVLAAIVFGIVMMEGVAPYITYPLPNKIQIGGNSIIGSPKEAASGFSIAFYAICILSGAVLVYIICDHRFYKIYGKHGMLESVFLTAFPAGIIGARLWFCYVLEFEKYAAWDGTWEASNNPFAIWDGGLAIMGGALLGIVVGVLWVIFVKKEIRIREAVDIIVPTILIAQAVGRWGNFFNLEVYGSAYLTMAEGFWIPSFIKFNMVSIDVTGFTPYKDLTATTMYHVPLFFVEFITNLMGYYFIRYLFGDQLLFKGIAKLSRKISKGNLSDKKYNIIANAFPKGGNAGMYLIWYGFTRLFLEPLRQAEYEYQASSDSAIMLICLGAGVIAIFAIYQYVIEPRYPFYKTRRKKYEALETANVSDSLNDEIKTDLPEAQKVEVEPKKSNKKDTGSLNDDL